MTPSPTPAPRPASPAPSTSTLGPRLLTATGVLLMVLALVAAALAAILMSRTLPVDVLGADGGPGAGAVGAADLPGSVTVRLQAGAHAVWLAVPDERRGSEDRVDAALTGEIEVTGLDGASIPVTSRPSVSGTMGRGGVVALTVGGFEAPTAGDYVVTAPAATTEGDALLLITEDEGFAPFFGSLMGTIGSAFLAFGLGALGVGLTAGGAVWWHRRRVRGLRTE